MKLAVLLFCTQLFAAPLAAGPADEAAVRDMVKRYADARDVSDPKAIGALSSERSSRCDEAEPHGRDDTARAGRRALRMRCGQQNDS